MYQIEYAKQVKKQIEKFPKRDKIAILEKIESLAHMPRPEGVVRMKGNFAAYYRIRVGDYRVILIVKIAQRGSVYLE